MIPADFTLLPWPGGDLTPVANLLNEAYSQRWSLPPLELEGLCWEPVTAESLAARVEEGVLLPDGLFVVRDGSRLLSAAWVRTRPDCSCAELAYLATRREKRRHGLASALLEPAAAWGRERGFSCLRTAEAVDSRLADLCAFLEARGFAWTGQDNTSVTMYLDILAWQPRPLALPPGFALTTFQPGDDPAWTELHNACFEDPWPAGRFTEKFAARPAFDGANWFFVEHQGRKVAMTGLDVGRDPETGRLTGSRIEWVCTREEYRGSRLGEAAVVAALNRAHELRADPLTLVTQYFRKPAVALYQKLGFTVARELRRYELPL